MNTATASAPLSFGDLGSVCETNTRSLIWFQEGDIGTARKTMIDSLPTAEVGLGNFEDILGDRTKAVQLGEQRPSRVAASLRATFVCALVGAWTAVEGEKTRGIALLRNSLIQASISRRKSYPVADFFKPVEYNWSETDFEADQALKLFSEHTHADS